MTIASARTISESAPYQESDVTQAGSWDAPAPFFAQDTMPFERDAYWTYDPDLSTVVFGRRVSWIVNVFFPLTTILNSVCCQGPVSRTHTSTPLRKTTSRSSSDLHDTSLEDESTLIETNPSPGKGKGKGGESPDTSCASLGDALVLQGLADSTVDTIDVSPVAHGLGIFGLTNANGTPFDGTGVVGVKGGASMRRSPAQLGRRRFSSGSGSESEQEDEHEHESGEMVSIPTLSRIMLDELAAAFGSSPAPSPARRRGRDDNFVLAELDQNALAGGSPRVRSVRGLGIIRRDGRGVRDGMGVVGLRDHRGVSQEEEEEEEERGSGRQISTVLVDEVANTFGTASLHVRVLDL